MLEFHAIDSFDLPELAPYRTMRRHHAHRARRIFVAEGVKIVRLLLESDLGVESVVLSDQWLGAFRDLLERRPERRLPVYLAEKKVVERLTGFSMFQGVLAVGQMPPEPSLAELLAQPAPRLFVAVDGLANAENIGAVVRCCGAFGAQGLLVGENASSPYLRRSVRSGMGIVFRLPVIESDDLVAALRGVHEAGVRVIAAHPRPTSTRLSQANLAEDCCLVFGSEGDGLREEVLAACDETVAVPMPAGVDSLNVSHAAAVFLYEAARQRGRT